MRLKKAALVMSGLLLAAHCLYAFAGSETNLMVDGFFTAFRTKPQYRNGCTMMAMREIAGLIDANVTWKDSTQTAVITKAQTELVLTVGTKRAYLNGQQIELPAAPMYNDGKVMEDILIPMRFTAETFGEVVDWDKKTSTISLTTGKDPLKIMDIKNPATDNAIVLDYNEALRNAFAANSTLLNLQESIEVISEKQNNLLDEIHFLGNSTDLDGQMFIDALRALRKLGDTLDNIPYNEQMVRESTEYILRNTLSSIEVNKMDLQILKERINLQATTVKNIKVKLELGMESEYNLRMAEQELAQSRIDQELLELMIASERVALGRILNLPMGREIVINFEPDIEPLAQPNLSALISASLNADPMLKIKETALNQAKYAVDTFTDSMTESKLEKQNNLYIASREYDDAKQDLESAIRTAYNKMNRIRENQKALELKLEKAMDNYKTLSVNYQAGSATMYDLDAGKLAILNAEANLAKNNYAVWTLSYGIAHPYLLVESKTE